MNVVMYTDGACSGNPGPGGWGTVLMAGKHRKELFGGERETTNNRMEMMAVIREKTSVTRGLIKDSARLAMIKMIAVASITAAIAP